MSKHYVHKEHPENGCYEVFTGVEGSRWHWVEESAAGIIYEDHGRWWPTAGEAYRDAADDWEDNGNGGPDRLTGALRAAATRADRTSK